ncbi:MAG TPA: response regulator [Pirellulaceae bacterium]|nr:response regulator [Pirellulaceae bacterium]
MNAIAREPAEILLVDDDPLALTAAAAALDMAGYIVHQAQDRRAALKAARTLALDLVICDVNLAGESGLELWRELRKLAGMEDVPVMFVSATQLPDIVRRSHEAGGAYYLRKPLDPEVLVELVGKALWLPHLVQSRVAMHQPAAQAVPAPAARPSAATLSMTAAITGIRLPLA